MPAWDEQVPGQQSPAVVPGTPQLPPAVLNALAAKLFGSGAQGGSNGPTPISGAVTPLAGPGGPQGTGAPPAVAGPQGGPPAPSGPNSRQMPSPNAMLGGSFAYPSGSAKNAAVVSTGIENMSEAILSFKVKKDEDQFKQAQTTFQMYQKAAQIDPATGQPVDPYTMSILANNPKLVKLWERYITGELPRAPSDPGAQAIKAKKGAKGKAQAPQGKPIIPVNQPAPQQQVETLKAQQELAQLKGGPTAPGQLSNEESYHAQLVKAGLQPEAKSQKDLDKIDADIAKANADATDANARSQLAKGQLDQMSRDASLTQSKIYSETKKNFAEAEAAIARANKDREDLGKAKIQVQFVTARNGIDKVATDARKDIDNLRKTATADRGFLRKQLGMQAAPSPEVDKAQERWQAIQDMRANYNMQQDDVYDKKISPIDALTRARQDAGLTSTYQVWGGIPAEVEKAFSAKNVPDGTPLKNPQGEVQAVARSGKWVAP